MQRRKSSSSNKTLSLKPKPKPHTIMNALGWNISKYFPHTYTQSHKRRSWAHTRVFIANGTCLPTSWIPQAWLWASSHPRCMDVSWGPYALFKVTVNSPKSWNQAREMPFPAHTSPQLRTPRTTSDTVRTSLSGLRVYREMAKFRRFLIPHTPIIILFSAVRSDEGGMLVLSSSAIFILASCFGSKICQNWKPPCVKWHLICPKQRRGELVHLSRLLLHVLSSQRLKSTELCSLVLAENPAQNLPPHLPFHLSTEPNLSCLPHLKDKHILETRSFLQAILPFFFLNTEGITPHFLGARRMSPVSFLKGMFPMVAMLVLTISSALLVLLPSLKIHFSSPAPNLCLLC